MWKPLVLAVSIGATLVWGQFFSECHDDPGYDPQEGPVAELQFTWLGALQYIHVKNGTPHYFRVPRVILITRQFVLSTANDASSVPEGYALGNVVFPDYERDEQECHTTSHDVVNERTKCEPGIVVMPVADVLLHPEFKNFGAKSSVALMKLLIPIRSTYVVPVCLPFQDSSVKPGKSLYHVDFMSDVPRDFIEEEKEITLLSLLPKELCFLYDNPINGSQGVEERVTCTTGCGLRSGAPILVHEHMGQWSAVGLSEGGCPCPDPLRERRPPAPPRHIMLQPYVSWITFAISGGPSYGMDKYDPFGYAVRRVGSRDPSKHGWVGHWWIGGNRCYDRADMSEEVFRFYHEVFHVKPANKTIINYYLMLHAHPSMIIVCVKVGMPHRLAIPQLWDLDTSDVRFGAMIIPMNGAWRFPRFEIIANEGVLAPLIGLKIPLVLPHMEYRFQVEAWGFNKSDVTSSSSSSI